MMKTKGLLLAALLLTACGGGGGGGAPEVELNPNLGPPPNFSDAATLQGDVQAIGDEVGAAIGKSVGDVFLGKSVDVAKNHEGEEAKLPVDLSTHAPLSGAKGGTATPTGSITGNVVSENEGQLTFSNVGVQFKDFSEKGEYVLNGSIAVNGNMMMNGVNGAVNMTLKADLTVSGKVAALYVATISLDGTLTPVTNADGKQDTIVKGTLGGTISISAAGKTSVCTVSGALDSASPKSIQEQISITCSTL